MSDASVLRRFLEQCQNSKIPLVYHDGVKQRQVYLSRFNEILEFDSATGKDESVAQLTLVEAQPETLESATGARALEIHLIRALNSATPVTYRHDRWGHVRVYLTQMIRRVEHEDPATDRREYSYRLTMVDAWGGVWVYQTVPVKVTVTKTVTLRLHTTDLIGAGQIGLAQIGV